ncbi:MAG: DUF763 domain-containing protein [Thermoprotei archaeon]|nr:MAG: DUF763 domain-containing protein [Thermoprotei archaeon]
MKLSGVAKLPLHGGRVPRWLFNRMVKLAEAIVRVMVLEYGRREFIRRLSDPFWFQAFGNVLGFDWHSSGVTTVVTGVLKEAINPQEFGIAVCGGKGKASLKTLDEITHLANVMNFSSSRIEEFKRASRLAAKVDNAALQDGYSLYHHVFIVSEDGYWTIVQQGLNVEDRSARRYHWLGEEVLSFVEEPHKSIVGDKKLNHVLNMVARESREARKISVDLVRENPSKLASVFARLNGFLTLDKWIEREKMFEMKITKYLEMPWRVNWRILKKIYEIQPRNYEELLQIRGVGPATIRGLAFIADLIYGEEPSWQDPVKYSFAFGGKDGVPYPINKKAMDEAIATLRETIELAEIGYKQRLEALKRLRIFIGDK